MPNITTPHPFVNLGGNDKPVDTRDVKLGAAVAAQYTFPATLHNDTAWSKVAFYQGQQPACGAHAGAGIKSVIDKSNYTPRFTWADIKTFDGNSIASGTDIRSIFKSITKQGVLDFNLMGNEVTLWPLDYAKPAVTAAMRQNAAKHSGMGYGFITDRTFNGLKQFIFDNGPSIILMRVGNEMWTAPDGKLSWAAADILPLRPLKTVVSGHFVFVHSYDEKYIYFLNSFGPTWGMNGHGYFEENYMPYFNDAGALFPLSFTHDLQVGMTDDDVKRLQVILNKNPKTQVALHGSGSPGAETPYFGTLTLAAVKKFQFLYSIAPVSGYVGPLTRAVLNGFV